MKTISVVGAAIIDPPYVLAFRRGPTVAMAGKWEFPGGKLERGESPRDALARELEEELRLSLPIGERLGIGTAQAQPRDLRRARGLRSTRHLPGRPLYPERP